MTETILKPCPFCGTDPNKMSCKNKIYCWSCGAAIRAETIEEAIFLWNSRASQQLPSLDGLLSQSAKAAFLLGKIYSTLSELACNTTDVETRMHLWASVKSMEPVIKELYYPEKK